MCVYLRSPEVPCSESYPAAAAAGVVCYCCCACVSPDWMDKHPGGSEVVHLMAGRDATDAFASYHPFTDKPRKVTNNPEIAAPPHHWVDHDPC